MVQPRSLVCIAMLMAACVAPVASFRRGGELNVLETVDTDKIFDGVKSEKEKDKEAEKEKDAFGPKVALDVETEILVRECVAARAKDWPDLHKRLGLTMKNTENATDAPLDLVIKVFKVTDKIENLKASRNVVKRKFSWAITGMKELTTEKHKILKDLLGYRFRYQTAHDRCAKGATDVGYACMVDEACPNHTADCKALADDVKSRIDARDLAEHLMDSRYVWQSYSPDEAHLWREVKNLTKALKDGGYKWKNSKKTCRQKLAESVKAIQDRVLDELRAGETQEDGTCQEAPGKMCPEGTYAITQRRWNPAAGAAAFGTGFMIAKFTLLPLGTAIGTALAGPAGGSVGLMAGNALVFPMAAMAGWWASRGPVECGCFARECMYNDITSKCELHAKGEAKATKNPFGDKLPMAGMKCSADYREGKKCDSMQCTQEDYDQAISGKTDLWGLAGNKGTNLYNCLTVSQSPSGILAIQTSFPDGRPNTIEERNKVFSELPMAS